MSIFVSLAVIIVAAWGSRITAAGLAWYQTITLPSFTPPGSIIGIVWTILFILLALAGIIVFQKAAGRRALVFSLLLLINLVLNVFWSELFFGRGLIGAAMIEAAGLGLSVLALIITAWPVSRLAASMLIPYFLWVSFATYLTYSIWLLNH